MDWIEVHLSQVSSRGYEQVEYVHIELVVTEVHGERAQAKLMIVSNEPSVGLCEADYTAFFETFFVEMNL